VRRSLLSVAEDVGAAFVRRGLPTRDITDSSLEDVIHIEPRTLPDSTTLLQTRVVGFTEPFVALAHALSGGLPRDLIRYTRKIIEINHRIGQPELNVLANHLLTEELIQTLSGFRVLLGNRPHSVEWGLAQHRLHATIAHLERGTRRPGGRPRGCAEQAWCSDPSVWLRSQGEVTRIPDSRRDSRWRAMALACVGSRSRIPHSRFFSNP
jgi:hypothetical protein